MTKSLENILAMIIVVVVLFFMPVVIGEMHYERCLTVTGRSSAEELASQISKEKELTVFNYTQHAEELAKCGYEGELQISYYVYETVAEEAGSSEKRRYVTTWDEIRDEMLLNQKYVFPDNAYVCVTAKAYVRQPSSFALFIKARTDYTATSYIERGGM